MDKHPRPHGPWLGWACTLLLGLGQLACATEPARPAQAESAAALSAQLQALIGDAPCDSQAQCRSIAVGYKACGGPSGYLAWSSKNADAAKLTDLARRQAAAAQAESQRSGMLSDCALLTDPGARCQAGRCVLGPPNAGQGGQQLLR